MIAGTDWIDLSPETNPSTSLSVTMATETTGATSSGKLSRDALTLYVRGYGPRETLVWSGGKPAIFVLYCSRSCPRNCTCMYRSSDHWRSLIAVHDLVHNTDQVPHRRTKAPLCPVRETLAVVRGLPRPHCSDGRRSRCQAAMPENVNAEADHSMSSRDCKAFSRVLGISSR